MMSQLWRSHLGITQLGVSRRDGRPPGEVLLRPPWAPSQFTTGQKEGFFSVAMLLYLLTKQHGFHPKVLQCAADYGPCEATELRSSRQLLPHWGLLLGNASRFPYWGI